MGKMCILNIAPPPKSNTPELPKIDRFLRDIVLRCPDRVIENNIKRVQNMPFNIP